jgi:DNA recombination-mediator protein A
MMKLAIVGSRAWPASERHMIITFVDRLPDDTVIVSGGARGVDQWAVEAARERGLQTLVLLPDWKRYGKSAGFIRNTQIVNACVALVAFQVDDSSGTQHAIDLARKAEKLLAVYRMGDCTPEWQRLNGIEVQS